EHGTFRGVNTMRPAAFTDVARELNRLGWRVATHAVGDAAIDEVLAGYEAANADRSIVGKRWTVEHGFIPQVDQFPPMRALALLIRARALPSRGAPGPGKSGGAPRAGWPPRVREPLRRVFAAAGAPASPVVPSPPLWVLYHFITRDTIS